MEAIDYIFKFVVYFHGIVTKILPALIYTSTEHYLQILKRSIRKIYKTYKGRNYKIHT